MRIARFKTDDTAMFYHLYNRVAGSPGFLPFGPREKEQFVRLLHKLDTFFCVRVVCYQVMSNHFHLIVHAPAERPSPEEVCRRYNTYYPDRPALEPNDPRCEQLAERMRDISWYMHALQQQFTVWYNRTRRSGQRRGGLWSDRFKHSLLGSAEAVWECMKYIEMNTVRVGIVHDPADYRFCSYGTWMGKNRHPFEQNVQDELLPFLEGQYACGSLTLLQHALAQAFREACNGYSDDKDISTVFITHIDRRVRYWTDGLIIGTDLFIQEMVARSHGTLRTRRRLPVQARAPDDRPMGLYSYKQLTTT